MLSTVPGVRLNSRSPESTPHPHIFSLGGSEALAQVPRVPTTSQARNVAVFVMLPGVFCCFAQHCLPDLLNPRGSHRESCCQPAPPFPTTSVWFLLMCCGGLVHHTPGNFLSVEWCLCHRSESPSVPSMSRQCGVCGGIAFPNGAERGGRLAPPLLHRGLVPAHRRATACAQSDEAVALERESCYGDQNPGGESGDNPPLVRRGLALRYRCGFGQSAGRPWPQGAARHHMKARAAACGTP